MKQSTVHQKFKHKMAHLVNNSMPNMLDMDNIIKLKMNQKK